MEAIKTVFSLTEPIMLVANEAFPFEDEEPDLEGIDYEQAGLPDAESVSFERVVFRDNNRTRTRKVLFDGGWTITGMLDKRDDCGNHLGLYTDGTNFTHTRSSCHRQGCPVCSWKWESRAGDDASRYLQFVVSQSKVQLRHAAFNPALSVKISGGHLKAAVDAEGHVIPVCGPGDMRAYRLEVLGQFLEHFHSEEKAGRLGYAYVLHPGREIKRGDGVYYYSPHVHIITNFTFDEDRVSEMVEWYVKYGFTFTMWKQKKTGDYGIHPWDYVEENKESAYYGRRVNALTKLLIYNFSHSLLFKDKRARRAIVYVGSFKPTLYHYVKSKRKILVKSKQDRAMYKCKARQENTLGFTTLFPERNASGSPVPELTKKFGLKWLKVWRTVYTPIAFKKRKINTTGWWARHNLPIDVTRERSLLGKVFLENLLAELEIGLKSEIQFGNEPARVICEIDDWDAQYQKLKGEFDGIAKIDNSK